MKALTGTVVSTKMDQTVVIERTLCRPHPIYKKAIKRQRRIKAHSQLPLNVGDKVKFVSSKPLSKEKHHRVIEKISQVN